ncbi:hypothetical protein BJ322DRAFT_1010522 [Thelephora terrestris]|uniref:Uncharacterized protein n=1 Tax=Thelephora terrestris TaxID=56493 RepID=A0A9P6HBP4_9AGAM|nr:hypothetical protein BJ322DRAFT_1010522 [Thelephora terrestris]
MPFIPPAIQYFQTVHAGQQWTDMVASFLRLEEFPPANGVRSPRLSIISRPEEVTKWMKTRSYLPAHIPFISNVSSYRDGWMKWWTSCQPPWRRGKGWPLPRDNEGTTNWVKIGARGQNGLFLVVVSTTWWAFSIRSEEEWVEFDKAVDDIRWVIDQVMESHKALQASEPPAPLAQPAPSQNPQKSKPEVTWMARATGKRQPKPSRKLLESRSS